MLQKVIFENYQKISSLKKWKSLVKARKVPKAMWNSNHNFPRFAKLFSVSLYEQFLWGNSRTWNISSQSWDTHICVGLDPKSPYKHEACTQKGCLKVQITLFFFFKVMDPTHFCAKQQKLGCFGTYLVNHEPKNKKDFVRVISNLLHICVHKS